MNIVDGGTKTLGIIGQGISHTMSPAMHNRAALELGINNVYLPFDLPAKSVEPFLKSFWDAGGVGLNITAPHKKLISEIFPEAKLSSVNTLYRGTTWWKTASTDGEGFERGLKRIDKSLGDFKEIVVLGNGGVALALLEYISRNHSISIKVLSRNSDKDDDLNKAVPSDYDLTFAEFEVKTLSKLLHGKDESTLLVQASSAPLNGDDLDSFMPALSGFAGVVVDVVYKTPSKLYAAAIAKDLAAQDGESMLIEQARLSQMLWWGRCASYEVMAKALRGK